MHSDICDKQYIKGVILYSESMCMVLQPTRHIPSHFGDKRQWITLILTNTQDKIHIKKLILKQTNNMAPS